MVRYTGTAYGSPLFFGGWASMKLECRVETARIRELPKSGIFVRMGVCVIATLGPRQVMASQVTVTIKSITGK
jgi:hypothetical protein